MRKKRCVLQGRKREAHAPLEGALLSHAADVRAQATGREVLTAGWSQVQQVTSDRLRVSADFPCQPPTPTPTAPAAETPPWRCIRTKRKVQHSTLPAEHGGPVHSQ